jgi:glycerol-3-phosphate O-acyltransferase / dihydroxyacetone phosphate acyltransferase
MIYSIAKKVLSFALTHFFSSIRVGGVSKVEHGPVIIVANHPNYALDPLIIGSTFRRSLWFVARSTLFTNNFLRWFFRQCHMVPIMRRMDSADGNIDNRDTFRFVTEVIVNGGGLCIFPEGISLGERKLSPLKTGTARMAFQAEESKAFGLGLVIQPVGLTYSDLKKFQSSVTLTFGAPICVADYKLDYEKDAIEAVQKLTEEIEAGIRSVTVEVSEIEQVALVEKITTVFKTKANQVNDLELMRIIASNVKLLRDKDPVRSVAVEKRIDNYLLLAKLFALDGSFTLDTDFNRNIAIIRTPLVLLGILINYLPYKLVGTLVEKVSRHAVDVASKKFGLGCIVFPLWHIFISLFFGYLMGSIVWSLFVFILCLLSAIFVNRYLHHAKLLLLSWIWPGHKKPSEVLQLLRDELIAELESLRIV